VNRDVVLPRFQGRDEPPLRVVERDREAGADGPGQHLSCGTTASAPGDDRGGKNQCDPPDSRRHAAQYAPRLLATLAACVAALAVPGAVLADGDPASDYLISQSAFVPSDTSVSTAEAGALTELLNREQRAGFPIRVAVIARRSDLGADGVIYRHPQYYASFLGEELSYFYRHELLVVMPNGYGVYKGGGVPAADVRTLARLPAPKSGSGDDLVRAAMAAVQALAKAHGAAASPAPPPAVALADRNPAWVVALLAVVAAATLPASVLAVWAQWRHRPGGR